VDKSLMSRFFGVVVRPATWLNVIFQVLSFPLGLFYFVFLVTGLSLGIGLVVVWMGIPILLVVAGAWWLFAAFERLQAQYLLHATVGPPPRAWETVNGVWAKLKAHFGSAATWKDLVYLLGKMAFGVISFSLLVTLGSIVAWLIAFPFAAALHVHLISWGNGQGWTPALWLGILAIPGAFMALILSLHIINGWGWVCARWAEAMFARASAEAPPVAAPAPIVTTSPTPTATPTPDVPPAASDASPAPEGPAR
jgi:hypothetical protein